MAKSALEDEVFRDALAGFRRPIGGAAAGEFLSGLRFLVSSCVTTIVQYGALIAGAQLIPPLAASVVAYGLAIPVNYFMNYYFTFGSYRRHTRAVARYLLVCLSGISLNTLIVWAALEAHIYYVLAQVIATIVLFIWNYLGLKLWAFV